MIKKIDKKAYHKFWKSHNGSILQSWQWGELKSEYWKVERLGYYLDEELAGIVTLFIRNFPYQKFLKFLGIKKFGYIPRGPILGEVDKLDKLIEKLSVYLKETSLKFVLIDPGKDLCLEKWDERLKRSLEENNWNKSGITIQPNQTDIIDVEDLDENILMSFRAKWRRNARKAKKHGVEIQKGSSVEDIDKFYLPLKSVAKRGSFNIREKKYFEKMWQYLKKDDLIDIFIAEKSGKPIASYLVVRNKKTAYELYGGSTLEGRDLEASFLLKQKILQDMRKKKITFYDQWGVAPKGQKDHPLSGISYFKKGFGGDYVQLLPQYALINSKLAFKMYNLFKKYRS